MKRKPKIRVMSRLEAFNYCKSCHNTPAVIISISTPNTEYPYKVFKGDINCVIDILVLSFADVDGQDSMDINDDYAAIKELMTDKDAKKIAGFVDRYKNVLLIIHCDEGVSRSAGIAAAVLRYYTGDDAAIFDDCFSYNPNMWCYLKS